MPRVDKNVAVRVSGVFSEIHARNFAEICDLEARDSRFEPEHPGQLIEEEADAVLSMSTNASFVFNGQLE